MTRSRTLLAALAAICVLALIVVIATLVSTHVSPRSESPRHGAARRDTARSSRATPSTPHDSFSDDASNQREPPPEPNVFGTVVDQEGNPVEEVLVSACHVAPYLGTPLNTEGLEDRYDFGPKIDPRDDPTRAEFYAGEGGFGGGAPEDTGFASGGVPGDGGQEVRVGPPWGKRPQCLTDEDGRFALRVCDKLWYGLVVEKDGYDSPIRIFRAPQEGIRLVLYGPGSIVGRVVDADTGEPVTHFTATLVWQTDITGQELDDGASGGPDEVPGRRVTRMIVDDDGGEFQFGKVRSSASWLSVEADGYVPVTQMVEPLMGVRIRLVVRLCTSAQLTGRVVWESSGKPLPGTAVVVRGRRLRACPEYGFEDMPPHGPVDAEGAFSMSQLPAGRVKVSVVELWHELSSATSAGSPLVEQELMLPAGKTTNVILKVPDQRGSVSGRVVTSEDGRPVENVQVSFRHQFLVRVGAFGEEPGEPMTTNTDSNGGFRFPDVPSGDLWLSVAHERYVMTRRRALRVKPGEALESIVIELARSARIEGRVTDAGGGPVEVAVYCSEAEPDESWTDEAGNYSLARVRPGWAVMSCRDTQNHETLVCRFVEIPPGAAARMDFVLPRTYTVSGRTTVARAAVEDGCYQLLPVPTQTDLSGGFVERYGWREEGGRFRFENVPPGRYTLVARFNAHPQGTLAASMPVEVVAADVELDLELPAGMITGRVLDEDSGEPIPYAMISIRREQSFSDPAEGKADVEVLDRIFADPYTGSYTFGPLGDGRYVVTASKDEYGAEHAEVDVVDGRMIGEADVRLPTGYEVQCTVASAQPGTPLSELIVTVRDAAQAVVARTYVNAGSDGAFSDYDESIVGHLAPGSYTLEAVSPTTAWQSMELDVTEHGKNLVEFRLPAGRTLVAEATDATGNPVVGAIPEIKDALGRNRLWRTGNYAHDWGVAVQSASDGKGLTRLEHLLPGTYTLTVRAAGYRTAEQQVTVLDADETRVKVVLERVEDE